MAADLVSRCYNTHRSGSWIFGPPAAVSPDDLPVDNQIGHDWHRHNVKWCDHILPSHQRADQPRRHKTATSLRYAEFQFPTILKDGGSEGKGVECAFEHVQTRWKLQRLKGCISARHEREKRERYVESHVRRLL